jgi:colanic acid biosynthesis glycosyl transferase WcaI
VFLLQKTDEVSSIETTDSSKLTRPKVRLWILSELYYPEESSTGHLVTQIAEGLADGLDYCVNVICAQPTYSKRGMRAPSCEKFREVQIYRVWSTTFSKDRLMGRLFNILTILISFSFKSFRRVKKGDVILVLTNPPILPLVAIAMARLKGAKTVLLAHDVYPDVLVPTGFTNKESFLFRIFDNLMSFVFRSMDAIIVLGRDMKERIQTKLPNEYTKIFVIPNWSDDSITSDPIAESKMRERLGLTNKFVVQYSGNIGRTHGVDTILRAAEILEKSDAVNIHWLICGWGGQRKKAERTIADKKLSSVTLLEPFPRDELNEFLNCCNVSIISFIPGMAGISVPSRMYNVLASGKPIIAVAEPNSELSLLISESETGWRVDPEDHIELARLVGSLATNRQTVANKSAKCVPLVQESYLFKHALAQYRIVLSREVVS